MRLAVDTGGTFTDLVIEDDEGRLSMEKSSTTPDDPICGVLDVVGKAARNRGTKAEDLLSDVSLFIHGTTRAINAILTGTVARTALITTAGHPDILLFREGGRSDPFNFKRPFPEPYIPRSLTFEVPERIGASGEIVQELDEATVLAIAEDLEARGVEAVAVCLLWSILRPAHELRVAELLRQRLPDLPITLSYQLNPTIREYRRASAAAIDASLKPLMTAYLDGLDARLRAAGFSGRLLVVTSSGGVLDAAEVAAAPIHAINSGPSMAPVAGRHYATLDAAADTAVVADTGGTSYDVSLVRHGRIPQTRETWLGPPYFGHMTGFASVDVRSIGAGGGSIAWVDTGGLLHVGPRSAGAHPGPVCYGHGGVEPTVTDACLALGYLDPAFFLGGDMPLDSAAAQQAIRTYVADPLGRTVDEAAAAIVELTTEHMVHAIEDITINQGIDPRQAVLIGGGGAAGLNSVSIARRLGCERLIIPSTGAALSAAGALLSDLSTTFARTYVTTSNRFEEEAVNEVLDALESQCREFIDGAGAGSAASFVELWAEARYPQQVWQLDVPLPVRRFAGEPDVIALRDAFHATHEQVFAVSDPESEIEVVAWHARARCRLRRDSDLRFREDNAQRPVARRSVYFPGAGRVEAEVLRFEALAEGRELVGPAIVESSFTTVVIEPGARFTRTQAASLSVVPGGVTAEEVTMPLMTQEA